ncbi:glucose-6-phosphate isomerase [Pancytospora philotis]|nr:glucose-6-phosphate isomerase [Pancytospora philotis]
MAGGDSPRISAHLDKARVAQFTAQLAITESDYLFYDMSKTHLTSADVSRIGAELEQRGLGQRTEDMWRGKPVNYTEKRPVLHYMLREKGILDRIEAHMRDSKKDAGADEQTKRQKTGDEAETLEENRTKIFNELVKIHDFCEEIKSMQGVTGRPIDTIVSIGIGGSDLGPRLVTDALGVYGEGPAVHFISNVDSSDALRVLRKIDVACTLFIVVSKTFTTAETMENLGLVRLYSSEKLGDASGGILEEFRSRHFVAVTANREEAQRQGIARVFDMWDFVGGRYSLWSAAGLSIALHIGFGNYVRLLRGASAADEEFRKNRADSIPVRLAINELYYIEKGYNNKCIVPYDSYLGLLYKYLQQAEMESNGKEGSGQMIIWGGTGTDVQHSFFQLLHQGEQSILTEFLLPVSSLYSRGSDMGAELRKAVAQHHAMLAANCFSQSRSLMVGRESAEAHKRERGDKPSVTILYSMLTPEVLGAIIAVYEHKIFVEGVYFGINSFDQFGVQLGKDIALELYAYMTEGKGGVDPSTESLIGRLKK